MFLDKLSEQETLFSLISDGEDEQWNQNTRVFFFLLVLASIQHHHIWPVHLVIMMINIAMTKIIA